MFGEGSNPITRFVSKQWWLPMLLDGRLLSSNNQISKQSVTEVVVIVVVVLVVVIASPLVVAIIKLRFVR